MHERDCMVRKVKDKYNVWLVGYYDDFNGARAIPNDDNSPDNTNIGDYSHAFTHFGNPLNGEATLNPRYRWSYYDRTTVSGYPNADEPYMFSLATNRLLHNKGAFEWLSFDTIRNRPNKQQGRSQLQYPDGHTNTNKFRIHPFTNGGNDAYQMFSNGHDTLGRYIVPTGDIDSTFGRRDMQGYGSTYTSKTDGKNSWVKDSEMGGSNHGVDDGITMVRRAHLAGKWMGEAFKYSSASEDKPLNVFAPLESPSGMPFLCVQQYNQTGSNSTPSIPTIYYDGTLNSRDTHDVLHFRLAVRSFEGTPNDSDAGKITPKVTIKAGYTSGPTPITTSGVTDMEGGLTGTAAISFVLDLTDYDTHPQLYKGNDTKLTYNNDDSWIDVDVVLDYDNNTYKVYQDGNLKSTTGSFTASAEDLYGWEIYMHPASGDNNVTSTLMLDRAALCRPLTDDPADRDLPPLDNLNIETVINGYSSCGFNLIDSAVNYEEAQYGFSTDNYSHNFTSMFSGNKLSDWGIVVFAGAGETGSKDIPRIDRPIWRGLISNIGIKEKANTNDRIISFVAQDSLSLLDKQIPMWELGQNKTNTLETFSPYWSYSAEGLKEAMDLGATSLKQFAANIGRTKLTNHENTLDQRTQLQTGHPIQMYNNEDANGPNDLEDDYEGAGIDYIFRDNTGVRIVLTGNPNVGASGNIVIDNTGQAYDGRTLAITAHHSIDDAGNIVTYNSAHSQEVLTIAHGSGTGQIPFVDNYTNHIAYIGKYVGPLVAHDDPNYSFVSYTTDSNIPVLRRFNNYMQFIEMNPATFENSRGSIGGLRITNQGSGYTKEAGYYTLIGGVKHNRGLINLPAPVNQDPSAYPYWAGETAIAEWESNYSYTQPTSSPASWEHGIDWNKGEITDVTITNGGKGYYSIPDLTGVDRVLGETGTAFSNNGIKSVTVNSSNGWPTQSGTSTGLATTVTQKHIVSGTTVNPSNPNDYGGYFFATSGSHSTSSTNDAILEVSITPDYSGSGTISIDVLKAGGGLGAPYAVNDTLVIVIPFNNPTATQLNIFVTVSELTEDAEFEVIPAEQAHTNTLNFFMDTQYADVMSSLQAGDEFVVSDTNATSYIRGKHIIKSIKKVLNFHGIPTDDARRYLWCIQTYTDIHPSFPEGQQASQGGYGNFNEKWGLLGSQDYWKESWRNNERLSWNKKITGTITPKPASMTEDISSRGIHARWMRDLPKSLWFRYHFASIQYNATATMNAQGAISAGATEVEIDQTTFNKIDNSGIVEIVRAGKSVSYDTRKDTRDFFIYKCKYEEGGQWFIGGCKYISLDHPTNVVAYNADSSYVVTPTLLKFIDNKDSYKHIWLLWADMRNDGLADADGGKRKKVFGLQTPTIDNYSVELQFDDQVDDDGNPQSWTELRHGEDYNMWDTDSTLDDSTGGAFSKPLDYDNAVAINGNAVSSVNSKLSINKTSHGLTTGDYVGLINFVQGANNYDGVYTISVTDANNFVVNVAYSSGISGTSNRYFYAATTGSDKDETQYQDWEDKGGAFVIVDTSKFFNLNTLANRGRVGQDGGGETDVGDYTAIGVGDPVLVDSYYRNAPSTTATTNSNYRKHPRLNKLVSLNTELASSVNAGHFWLEPTDATMFEDTGVGKIVGKKLEGTLNSTFYFTWNGRVESDIQHTNVTVATPNTLHTYWSITKTGATFISDGVKAGAYVENVSKPLVAGVGDSWKTSHVQKHYYRVKKVVSETQLQVERVSYYNGSMSYNVHLSSEDFSGWRNGLYKRNGGFTQDMIDDGWATGHTLKICKQLFNVMLDSVNSGEFDSEWSPASIKAEFTDRLEKDVGTNFDVNYPYASTGVILGQFDETLVYTSTANQYAYRMMMKINGKYKNTNSGTFYESDKMRALWSLSLLDSWWAKTRLTSIFDIQNVPITENMTTYNTNSTYDSYGSIFDSNGKQLMKTIKENQKMAGVGDESSTFTSFSWLVGRDNRIDFRPKYNSGYNITRDKVKISDFNMIQSTRIDNVRVRYNGGNSFVDYPEPAVSDTTSWKIIDMPKVLKSSEALVIAEKEYNARKKNPLQLNVAMLRHNTDDKDSMLDGGRYGYIADAQVALQGNADNALGTAWCWTIMGTGGVPFSGMVNALDGNLGSVVTSSTLHSRFGLSDNTGSGTVEHQDNYKWYGSRSISKALQIVHVAKDIPKISPTTGEKLRVVIAVTPNQATTTTIDEAQFRVLLLDCSFTTNTSSGYAVDLKENIEGHSYVDIQHNGFYEMDIPTTYGTGKVVISFNADYCRDLLRSRCGDPTATAGSGRLNVLHNSVAALGIPVNGAYPVVLDSYNYSKTIFPLGCREYTNMGGGFGDDRAMWYAPTLNIVDDVMYVPATYVKYTDAGFDINNKTMVIDSVSWKVGHKKGEEILLGLREDESTAAGGVMSYILQPAPDLGDPNYISNVTTTVPPSGNITDEVTQDVSINGKNPSQAGYSDTPKLSVNQINSGTYSALNNSMNVDGSKYSAQYDNSILGQNVMPTTPASMRGMPGALRVFPTEGSATEIEDGISLPGAGRRKLFTEGAQRKQEVIHRAEAKVKSPPDAINDEINVTADISLPHSVNSGDAVLYVDITCAETSTTISEAISIKTGSNISNMQLTSTGILSGAGTTGNTITVGLSRQAGKRGDSAKYTALKVSNLNINFKRAAVNAPSSSNIFKPYN